jgi:hypothetical protein
MDDFESKVDAWVAAGRLDPALALEVTAAYRSAMRPMIERNGQYERVLRGIRGDMDAAAVDLRNMQNAADTVLQGAPSAAAPQRVSHGEEQALPKLLDLLHKIPCELSIWRRC